jgi:hypothetical protein
MRRGEGAFDADRADVWKKGVPRRRACLDRRSAEVLVEIEERRVLRRKERGANHVTTGGHVRAHAHRRALAEERLRPVLPGSHRRLQTAAALGRGRASAAIPIHERQPLGVEEELDLLARYRPEPDRGHVVPEDRRDRNRVVAVGGKQVLDEQAAARAERQPFDVIVLRSILARAVDDERRLLRFADCEPADLLRRGHIRLDQRRGNTERAGDVVEPRGRIVRWQVLRRIDRQVEQIADRISVLGSIEAMQAGRRRVRRRVAIELVLEPRDHRVEGRRIRAGAYRPAASCPHAACARPAPRSWRRDERSRCRGYRE